MCATWNISSKDKRNITIYTICFWSFWLLTNVYGCVYGTLPKSLNGRIYSRGRHVPVSYCSRSTTTTLQRPRRPTGPTTGTLSTGITDQRCTCRHCTTFYTTSDDILTTDTCTVHRQRSAKGLSIDYEKILFIFIC